MIPETSRPIGITIDFALVASGNLSEYDKALLYRALNTERNTILRMRTLIGQSQKFMDEWNKQLASIQGMLLHFDLEEESNQVT